MRQNEIDTLELEQSTAYFNRPMRVIASHRAPSRFHFRGVFFLLVLGLASGIITTHIMVFHVSHAPAEPIAIGTWHEDNLPAEVPLEPLIEERESIALSVTSRMAERKTPGIETVITFAMAQRGERYTWGGAGPNAWDCSGLIMQAFAQIDVAIGHYTGSQMQQGEQVTRGELQRGDIVFPIAEHVGIYLGEGKVLAANIEGVVVFNLYSFYTARRLV